MKKGIIRTILDNHRDVELYRRALTDIVLMLKPGNFDFTIQRYGCFSEMNYIVRRIKELKSFEESNPSKHQSGD